MGYFTSKEGREGATNYQPVPGNIKAIFHIKKAIRYKPG
jgi:hypothetical protein